MAQDQPYSQVEDAEVYEDTPANNPWMRGVFMFLFVLMFALAETLLSIIALLQFLWSVVTKAPNKQLRAFGYSMSIWMRDVAQFQACETEEKPFPFAPWPKDG